MTSVLEPVPESTEWSLPPRGRAGGEGLIVAEASPLGVFVVAYRFYLGSSLNGPYPEDVLEVAVLNTLCLLASSVTVARAVRALRHGDRRRAGIWFPVTIVLGAAFLAGTAREWYGLIVGHG